jgi:hypothetical protein
MRSEVFMAVKTEVWVFWVALCNMMGDTNILEVMLLPSSGLKCVAKEMYLVPWLRTLTPKIEAAWLPKYWYHPPYYIAHQPRKPRLLPQVHSHS